MAKIEHSQILDFLKQYPECYVINRHTIQEGEIGINVKMVGLTQDKQFALIREGVTNACLIPNTKDMPLNKKTHYITLEEYQRQYDKKSKKKIKRAFTEEELEQKLAWQKEYQEKAKECASKYELMLLKKMKYLGFGYHIERQHIFKYGVNGGNVFFFDLFIPKYNIAIEVDGEYHFSKEQKQKDKKRDFITSQYHIITLRIKNADVKDDYKVRRLMSKIRDIIEDKKINAHVANYKNKYA